VGPGSPSIPFGRGDLHVDITQTEFRGDLHIIELGVNEMSVAVSVDESLVHVAYGSLGRVFPLVKLM
jgi:hypothetical protein